MNQKIYAWAVCDGSDKEGILYLGSKISTNDRNDAEGQIKRTITLHKIRYNSSTLWTCINELADNYFFTLCVKFYL